MPSLLSGKTLRRGGSGQFIDLAGAMPQLPATDTTLTGFTLVTDALLRTSYKSSLGFIEFTSASMYSALPAGTITILNTGTQTVAVNTNTGVLVVRGGIGVHGAIHTEDDIVVNGITIGAGYEGINNIVFRGSATIHPDGFEDGKASIAIGYDVLQGITTSLKNIGIGRYALSSGTNLSNNIAIGDSALKLVGVFTSTTTLNDSNIGIGVDAGVALIDGQQNVIIGHQAANVLTTGSYNIIIGPLAGQYLFTGSGIISIGGDNIVDGKNDQVNIGSVFYYDGQGYSYIAADTTVGLGTTATVLSTGSFTSSSTVTGGLVVVGGIFGWDNLILVDGFEVKGTGTSTIAGNLDIGGILNVLGTGTSTIAGPLVPTTSGATLGSIDNPWNALYVSGSTIYLGTITFKSTVTQELKIESIAGPVRQIIGNLTLNSGEISSGTNNGSLVVIGGVGISGGLNVGGAHDVDLSPTSADVFIQPTAGGRVQISSNAEGSINNMTIGISNPAAAAFDGVTATNLIVTSTANSTSTTTGAVQIVGGVGIQGDVYSNTGIPEENYMLYTPRITVSTSSPVAARIGDIWIEPTIPAYLQYILDGPNKIWVQIGTV